MFFVCVSCSTSSCSADIGGAFYSFLKLYLIGSVDILHSEIDVIADSRLSRRYHFYLFDAYYNKVRMLTGHRWNINQLISSPQISILRSKAEDPGSRFRLATEGLIVYSPRTPHRSTGTRSITVLSTYGTGE